MFAGGEAVLLSNIPETRGETLVACAHLIWATCTRRMQKVLEQDEVGRARLEMRWLLKQPQTSASTSGKSEERAGKRLRSIAAGKAAPSKDVLNELVHIEFASRKRAADTSHQGHDPRLVGNEGTADDDVTSSKGDGNTCMVWYRRHITLTAHTQTGSVVMLAQSPWSHKTRRHLSRCSSMCLTRVVITWRRIAAQFCRCLRPTMLFSTLHCPVQTLAFLRRTQRPLHLLCQGSQTGAAFSADFCAVSSTT